jgi:hypothetical protein
LWLFNSRRKAHFLLMHKTALNVLPNVRGNRPAEAGGVSPVCDDASNGTHRAYAGCRSGSG